ncbi:MAG: hypothetical protein AB7E76_00070 [Deferribacterales bacterium]|jgi:hypothetical protein
MQIFTTSGERAAGFPMEGSKKLSAMLSAAVIAIAVNTFMLKIAPVIKIKAGAGGLFGLLKKHYGTAFTEVGLSGAWTALGLPQPGTLLFYILFHSFIGFMMSILYVYAIEKYLAGTGIRKGAVFSMLPWLFNSIVVLPMLGNGFAGSRVIGLVGITYFFIANGVFGILLGYLYERFSRCLVKDR